MRASSVIFALSTSLVACCPETGWVLQSPDAVAPRVAFRGDDTCERGAADCNVCAPDVVGQFAGGWQGQQRKWRFDEPVQGNLAPRRAYAPLAGHVQGFVRLNVAPEAYAMLHSHNGRPMASISFIGERNGALALESLYRLGAPDGHTSGAFVIGQYVGFLDADRQLALVDGHAPSAHSRLVVKHLKLSNPDETEGNFMDDPQHHGLTDWSGGLAMAKLQGGTYLLLANEGGGSAGKSHFFELAPFEEATNTELPAREWGHAEYPPATQLCAEHHHSENVALITECGSGDIYAVHVGSNDAIRFGKTEVGGHRTFWRLSRVVQDRNELTLEPVGVYLRQAHLSYCHGRSAGTAFVDPTTRRIDLLCHERAQGNTRRGPWHFWSESSVPGELPARLTNAPQ